MRSYRGLGDLPIRLGLSTAEGAAVQSLPYSEGQLVVSIADDWTRVRCPLQVKTYGARLRQAAGGVGTLGAAALVCRNVPIRLVHAALQDVLGAAANTQPVKMGRRNMPDADHPALTVAATQMLEGPGVGLDEADAQFVGLGTFAVAGPIFPPLPDNAFVNFFIGQFGNASSYAAGVGQWLPRILLPGESLTFQSLIENSILQLSLVWEELPVDTDVLTSQAREVGIFA